MFWGLPSQPPKNDRFCRPLQETSFAVSCVTYKTCRLWALKVGFWGALGIRDAWFRVWGFKMAGLLGTSGALGGGGRGCTEVLGHGFKVEGLKGQPFSGMFMGFGFSRQAA